MKLFLATLGTNWWNKAVVAEFEQLASQDRFQAHQLTNQPTDADAILMVDLHQHPDDWRLGLLEQHPLMADFRNKILVYDERDEPWCRWPGIYVSMPSSSFEVDRQRAWSYCHFPNTFSSPPSEEPDLLFSFQGFRSHPVRDRLFALHHPRALIENIAFNFFENSGAETYQSELARRKQQYREVVGRSKFILCPRGVATSSFRLYEALSAQRVPVIVSDLWVAPKGPDWSSCSIRVREADVDQIPRDLERKESSFGQLSTAALQVYREWFAADVIFHRLAEQCMNLLEQGKTGRHPLYFLKRPYLKHTYRQHRASLRRLIKPALAKSDLRN